jgi:hypothetical protein
LGLALDTSYFKPGVGPAVFFTLLDVSPSLDSDKTDTKIDATFDTHHVVVGVSFRF